MTRSLGRLQINSQKQKILCNKKTRFQHKKRHICQMTINRSLLSYSFMEFKYIQMAFLNSFMTAVSISIQFRNQSNKSSASGILKSCLKQTRKKWKLNDVNLNFRGFGNANTFDWFRLLRILETGGDLIWIFDDGWHDELLAKHDTSGTAEYF